MHENGIVGGNWDPNIMPPGPKSLTTVGNNGAANCASYCAYNWNSEVTGKYADAKGACCVSAHKSDDPNTPISCTTAPGVLGAGKSLKCVCQVDNRPFLTGNKNYNGQQYECDGKVFSRRMKNGWGGHGMNSVTVRLTWW